MKTLSGPAKASLMAAVVGVVGIAGMGAAAVASDTNDRHAGMSMSDKETGDDAAEEAHEGRMLADARVTAGSAAAAAERQTGLKAAEVELDDESATPVWEVSVSGASREQTVMVDGLSGKVTSVSADDGEGAEGGADAD